MLASNHLSENLVTKGLLNISLLTKGFILPSFKFVIIGRRIRRGGVGLGELQKGIREIGVKEIDTIEVYVDWYKKRYKGDKKIYVDLIEKRINAELIKEFDKEIKIDVKLIEK